MSESRELGRLVKTAKSPEAAALPAEAVEQVGSKHDYDLDQLAASLPDLERKPKELKTEWKLRLIDFVYEQLNGHEGLTVGNPEDDPPEEILKAIKYNINFQLEKRKAEESQKRGIQVGNSTEGPIYAPASKFKIIERQSAEQMVGEALSELQKDKPLKAGLEELDKQIETRDSAPAPKRKKYGQQITDLSNKMRREKSPMEERVRAGLVLVDEYDRRIQMAGSSRQRNEFIEKRQAVERYLESTFPRKMIMKDRDFTRNAAQITLARVPKYTEPQDHPLNAPSQEQSDEKFKEITRQEWAKDLVAHGVIGTDENGAVFIRRHADLDGKVALALLRMAGIDAKFQKTSVQFVAAGDSKKGKINIDTGGRDSLAIEDEGQTAYFDHHTEESGSESSATKVVYEVLTKLGMLENRKTLDSVVEFVTRCDNMSFPREAYGTKSYNTMVGLRNYLSFGQIMRFLKEGYNPMEGIPDEELKSMVVQSEKHARARKDQKPQKTLYDISRERLITAKDSEKRLQEMEKQGLVIQTKDYGKVVVDIDGKVKNSMDAAKAYGAGAFVKWTPKNNSFFLTTFNKQRRARFSQGKPIRGSMWIKPRTDADALTIKLDEVVQKLAGEEFKPTGELKEYLEIEKLEAELRNKLGELFTRKLESDGMTRAQIASLKDTDPKFRSLWEQGINNLYKKYYK